MDKTLLNFLAHQCLVVPAKHLRGISLDWWTTRVVNQLGLPASADRERNLRFADRHRFDLKTVFGKCDAIVAAERGTQHG